MQTQLNERTKAQEMMVTSASAMSPVSVRESLAWDFPPLIERLVENHGLAQDEAQALFMDLKKFLVVCASRKPGDPRLSPPERIDLAWHEFILFTMVYAAFCRHLCGRYLHHTPYTAQERAAQRGSGLSGDGVARAITVAQQRFGALGANWSIGQAKVGDCEGCAPSTACGMNDPSCW